MSDRLPRLPRLPRQLGLPRRLVVFALSVLAATSGALAVGGPAIAVGPPAGSGPLPAPAALRAESPTSAYTWPLPGHPPVLRRFSPPPTPYAPGHRGVDLGATVGTPVLASGAGVIGFAAQLAGRGVVTVVFDNGLRTTYEPVRPIVRQGERVARGQQIGWLATPTGHCGPGMSCLHWGLLRGSVYLDPLMLLGGSPVRLFPLNGGPPGRSGAPAATPRRSTALSSTALSSTAPRSTAPPAAASAVSARAGPGTEGERPRRGVALSVALALGAAGTLTVLPPRRR